MDAVLIGGFQSLSASRLTVVKYYWPHQPWLQMGSEQSFIPPD